MCCKSSGCLSAPAAPDKIVFMLLWIKMHMPPTLRVCGGIFSNAHVNTQNCLSSDGISLSDVSFKVRQGHPTLLNDHCECCSKPGHIGQEVGLQVPGQSSN